MEYVDTGGSYFTVRRKRSGRRKEIERVCEREKGNEREREIERKRGKERKTACNKSAMRRIVNNEIECDNYRMNLRVIRTYE